MIRLPKILSVLVVAMLAGSVASAQHFEDDEAAEDATPILDWVKDAGNRASIGMNGLLTAPADPVMFAIEGDDVFESLPAAAYTGRVVGFFAGAFQMPYRVLMGTFDVVFAWVPALYMQSPAPRFSLLPWAVHDDE